MREVLATEMLEAQGVYTSKSLSLVETGEDLVRHDEPSPTRGAVLVRLNHGHIRIGSFQRQAALGDEDALRRLLDYSVRTYIPEARAADAADRAAAFLAAVCARVARLGAQWMAAGFVHGVLNTDNINITGESFDYGPWRWLPTYDPAFTAAYFDESGLYAYGRQPETLQWNLTRLAECLLPLADKDALIAGCRASPPPSAPPRTRRPCGGSACRPARAGCDALAQGLVAAMAESQIAVRAGVLRRGRRRAGRVLRRGVRPGPRRPRWPARCPGRPDHPYYRGAAMHHADRRGGGDLGADRRRRRLVRVPRQARRDRGDAGRDARTGHAGRGHHPAHTGCCIRLTNAACAASAAASGTIRRGVRAALAW